MLPDRGSIVALAVCFLALGAGLTPVVAADGEGATPGGEAAATVSVDVPAAASLQANNSTVRHRNPEDVREDGDLHDVQSWLAGRLGEQLAGSTLRLSESEYELARSLVDEEYRNQLGKYVDVAGDTADESDDRAADAFDEAAENQEDFVTQVETYRETRREYEEAREAGDEERARELARELDRLAAEVNETGEGLVGNYGVISNETDVSLDEESRIVANITENVTDQQATIRAAEFVETELVATTDTDRASFTEPLTVRARLTAANGTPLADRTLVLETGEGSITATTDADGEATFEYRPTLLPTGNQSMSVGFGPPDASAYLGATDEVTATIEQVEPTVEISNRTEGAGFGDRIVVRGSIGADGIGAEGVPLDLVIGGVHVGTVDSAADGTVVFDGSLPASVEPGQQPLVLRQPLEGRALATAWASGSLWVDRTNTSVDLATEGVDGREIGVAGALQTTSGDPVADQPIQLAVNGSVVTTVSTGEDGSFDASVTVPAAVVPADERRVVVVTARFDGAGTNLDSAVANATATVDTTGEVTGTTPGGGQSGDGDSRLGEPLAGGDGPLGIPGWAWLGLLAALLLGLGALYRYRGWFRSDGEAVAGEERAEPEPPSESPSPTGPPAFLDTARSALQEGRADEAVIVGYTHARNRLEALLDRRGALTHWEFYDACEDADLDASQLEALRSLTEAYELAAFTREQLASAAAEDGIAAAADLAGRAGTDRSAPTGDD